MCIAVTGIGAISSLLTACVPLSVYKTTVTDNFISVPLGSILPEDKLLIVRTDKLNHDILLVIKENKNYFAFKMQCTHFDNALVANKRGLTCNLHGSSFDLNGEVINGPASRSLKKFKVIEENNNINIYL